MLYRMYTRWAERHGFTYKIMDYQDGDTAGIKSADILIEGENATASSRVKTAYTVWSVSLRLMHPAAVRLVLGGRGRSGYSGYLHGL